MNSSAPEIISPLEGKLEPEARDCGLLSDAALLSIAISLKRIADTIERPQFGNTEVFRRLQEVASG